MGPVMFVFDVSDTEPIPDMKHVLPVPTDVMKPFEVISGTLKPGRLERLIENAKRDGVKVPFVKDGSCSAGLIRWSASTHEVQLFHSGNDKHRAPIKIEVPVRYELFINSNGQSVEAQYATLVHEIAHLYCGHIGTPDIRFWPDRPSLDHTTREFEAESVSYLVCNRQGIETTSPNYLAEFAKGYPDIPSISMEAVMKAAGLIETMSMQPMKLRKEQLQ